MSETIHRWREPAINKLVARIFCDSIVALEIINTLNLFESLPPCGVVRPFSPLLPTQYACTGVSSILIFQPISRTRSHTLAVCRVSLRSLEKLRYGVALSVSRTARASKTESTIGATVSWREHKGFIPLSRLHSTRCTFHYFSRQSFASRSFSPRIFSPQKRKPAKEK